MEELFELRTHIEAGRYAEALALLGEMEEMGREDKINKIESFLDVLLIHLIKKHAEKRTTRSWEASIHNSLRQIKKTNKRRKAGGYYLSESELRESVDESYYPSLKYASLEAFGGAFDEAGLARKVDESQIKKEALELILKTQQDSKKRKLQ
ncbi:DUF29 family protein [Desulfonema magnum]|uniref:DUF29 n=1 Tax=Desulfonema magnum TaxID=45655 RepID=A0A975GN33_9BACT|nr:DUF29 family protein [Desulfonema magnum]QTA87312.1 DUF29 [Desulfonema magnum]